jgi:cytochrome oxidase Cu insertion factor (SCO1/SenC/PrrC family)
MPSRRTLFLAMAALAVAAALVGAALVQRLGHVPMGTGTALVGGPFTLINQDGQTVTDKDFSGKYMLIFFGYTYCPDVCPTELQVMTQALVTMGERAASIRPLFITIDPERDTPEVMKSYVENFGGNLIGLTGSAEQIAAVAKAYRVYYKRAGSADASDYLMDHSSIIYLMGPDGSFVTHFSYTTAANDLAAKLTDALEALP